MLGWRGQYRGSQPRSVPGHLGVLPAAVHWG